MDENRREFLEKGLVIAGALGAGLGTSHVVRKLGGEENDKSPLQAVLAANGDLMHVRSGEAVPHHHHPLPPNDPEVRMGVPGRRWIMVIDLAKCDGCKNCTTACNQMHQTPSHREWIRVFKMQDTSHTAPYWFPKPCFHCDNPPCTKVCPVGATFKRQDGIVLIDNERCIGCRFCMAACPYSTRFFNWERPKDSPDGTGHYSPEIGGPRRVGTPEKCDFCPEMAKEGKLPACVTGCSMGAIYFGDENEDAVTNALDETEQLSKLLEDRAGYVYLEELGTHPRVYYLPPKKREYPAPALAKPVKHSH